MTIYSCQENIAKLWTWRSFRTPHFGKHYHFSFDLITGVTPSYRHQAGNTDYRNFIKNNLQFIKWETFTLYLIRIRDENTLDNDIGNLMVGGLLYTSLYTWSDLMICFDSALFPQNFVWESCGKKVCLIWKLIFIKLRI